MDISSLEYKRAFETYMRKGVPIALSLKKQERTGTHYIWRTRKHGKVRDSHAANDGKIFAWDDPPPTGHPGEAHGCRCLAEPYSPQIVERINITLSNISDSGSRWSSRDFLDHYFNGNGKTIRVRETGHLSAIIAEYRRIVIDDPTRLPTQIANKARESTNGTFSDDFDNTYDMTSVVFSVGNTVIGIEYRRRSSKNNGVLSISGSIEFYLKDAFKDALDIFNFIPDSNLEMPGSQPFQIYDFWRGKFEGEFYADESVSTYKRPKQ